MSFNWSNRMNVRCLVPSVSRWRLFIGSLGALGLFVLSVGVLQPVHAADLSKFRRIEPQYIAALAEPGATSGNGAQSWGIWSLDPGPRGSRLDQYDQLKAAGVAPAGWKFDAADWWLEENGLIMEQPSFPLPPGKYAVTGDRKVTTVLTIYPKDPKDGNQRWELADGATIYDVTHLGCRAARYKPATANNSCSPAKVRSTGYPVKPEAAMPVVNGCRKQDYAVLIIVGLPATQ